MNWPLPAGVRRRAPLDGQHLDPAVAYPRFHPWKRGQCVRHMLEEHIAVEGERGIVARTIKTPSSRVELQQAAEMCAHAGQRGDRPSAIDDYPPNRPGSEGARRTV